MKETSKKTANLVEEPEEEHEEYGLNYIMTGNTINITVNDGGKVVFQSGKAPGHPPPPPGGGG